MDWFEQLTGFREVSYDNARSKLSIDGDRLRSSASQRSYGIGSLEWPNIASLRERAAAALPSLAGKLSVSLVRGDVGALHRDPGNGGALFQVASQFNLLEMTAAEITPEHGVTRYQDDRTQGPACAIAAGAATIYRNYFASLAGGIGQTRARQIDCLADIGVALGNDNSRLWQMQNGYAQCSDKGLYQIASALGRLKPPERDALRDRLRIGVHWNVEVTQVGSAEGHRVSQAFCSALPVNYSGYIRAPEGWRPFAELILEGAYEGTLWAAALNAAQYGSRIVYLTRLGGGVFANEAAWIDGAMRHALRRVADLDLDVRINCHGAPDATLLKLVADFA